VAKVVTDLFEANAGAHGYDGSGEVLEPQSHGVGDHHHHPFAQSDECMGEVHEALKLGVL
jgi:hypothetical protein